MYSDTDIHQEEGTDVYKGPVRGTRVTCIASRVPPSTTWSRGVRESERNQRPQESDGLHCPVKLGKCMFTVGLGFLIYKITKEPNTQCCCRD